MTDIIKQAAALLQKGAVVAIPTETVYGLAAIATNTLAVAKIYQLKGRPSTNPLIVHISDSTYLPQFAINIPDIAYKLFAAFAPGPLTILLQKNPVIPSIVTAGQNTIALRIPRHPLALQILNIIQTGVAAPSANKSNYISPTSALHVRNDFTEDELPCIVDGGECMVGIESTIISLIAEPIILRQGQITCRQLESVCNQKIAVKEPHNISIPGQGKHYAPKTPLKIISGKQLEQYLANVHSKTAVITFTKITTRDNIMLFNIPKDPNLVASNFYSLLRHIDNLQFDQIIIEAFPTESTWHALQDRAWKAAL